MHDRFSGSIISVAIAATALGGSIASTSVTKAAAQTQSASASTSAATLTPDARKAGAAEREYRLALMQATETCKIKYPTCNGGKYDPTPSPRRAELPPRYNIARMNRHDGPEDGTLADHCLTAGLPGITGFRRIVQTPGGIAMFYDVGQGQGWQRNIVMDGSPH